MAEKRLKVAAAMHYTKDKRVFVLDAVHDHIFAHGQGTVAGAEIFLARPSEIGGAGKEEETVCDDVDEVAFRVRR